VLANPNCKTYNQQGGACLSCWPGNSLSNGNCVVGDAPPANNTSNVTDPNCAVYVSGQSGPCAQCVYRTIKDANGKCVEVNPQCNTFNATSGACLSCFPGWNLVGNACVNPNAPSNTSNVTDPNCAVYVSGQSGPCAQCVYRTIKDANGKCVEVNPQCNTFNATSGACLSCFPGWNLVGNTCVLPTPPPQTGINCATYAANGACATCYAFSYLKDGNCVEVNAQCKTFDYAQSKCTACYPGYVLNASSTCIVG